MSDLDANFLLDYSMFKCKIIFSRYLVHGKFIKKAWTGHWSVDLGGFKGFKWIYWDLESGQDIFAYYSITEYKLYI